MQQDFERRFLSQHNASPPGNANKSVLSPQTTPTKVGVPGGGDRFIPVRLPNTDLQLRFSSLHNDENPAPSRLTASAGRTTRPPGSSRTSANQQSEESRQELLAHRALLRNEILKEQIQDFRMCVSPPVPTGPRSASRRLSFSAPAVAAPKSDLQNLSPRSPLFQFKRPTRTPLKRSLRFDEEAVECKKDDETASKEQFEDIIPLGDDDEDEVLLPNSAGQTPYALTPLSSTSQRMLRSPRKPSRKIPKNPYKVLDAPDLQDDFYLNLLDWSSQNMLAVGLGSCVYLWNAWNSNVSKLCDLSDEEDTVTSVQWNEKGDIVAVGTGKGLVGLWDLTTAARTLNLSGHTARVGCISWNMELVCSGSRDRVIMQRDMRIGDAPAARKLTVHKQEVCGLKWSPDRQYLASGGNDNQLLIWSLSGEKPIQTYVDHVAAVKALSWSPHHHGLLVSGGGTADRCLRFWNTLTSQAMQAHDTGSQVCNVAWSKHSSELVSTHGYSQNQIVIWKYPSLKQVVKLTGHTYRVLYLAMSPDGESIVTGAGDETLRFWQVFSKQRSGKEARSKLTIATSIR